MDTDRSQVSPAKGSGWCLQGPFPMRLDWEHIFLSLSLHLCARTLKHAIPRGRSHLPGEEKVPVYITCSNSPRTSAIPPARPLTLCPLVIPNHLAKLPWMALESPDNDSEVTGGEIEQIIDPQSPCPCPPLAKLCQGPYFHQSCSCVPAPEPFLWSLAGNHSSQATVKGCLRSRPFH